MSIPMTFRSACLLGVAVCAGLMGYALYAQHGLGLDPCPLCVLQRIAVIATGVVFLVAGLHAPRGNGRWVYGLAAFLSSAAGAGVAGRHVWLQSLPADQVPACGPGYDYMMDAFPFAEALKMIFSGSGECAAVDWTFLGQSMPVWTLSAFVALAVWALVGAAFARRPIA